MLPDSYYYDSSINTGATYTTDEEHSAISFDQFMSLFLEQMKHQDPTEPQDSEKILEQTSQLSNLEILNKQTETLESLNSKLDYLGTSNYIHYIGKDVSLNNNTETFTFDGTTQNYYFNLAQDAQIVAGVVDSDGNTVKTFENIVAGEGINKIFWNGTDDYGNTVSSGNYTWKLYALDQEGSGVSITSDSFKVNSIIHDNGKYYISLDDSGNMIVDANNVGVIK